MVQTLETRPPQDQTLLRATAEAERLRQQWKREQRNRRLQRLVPWLIGAVLLGGWGLYQQWSDRNEVATRGTLSDDQTDALSEQDRVALDRLSPMAEEYAAVTAKRAGELPVLRGRIVPVNVGGPGIEEAVYIRLPEKLRARSPQEVSTIVKIKYVREAVGEYKTPGDVAGTDAERGFAVVTVFDRVSGKQFIRESIPGPPPPEVLESDEDWDAPLPGPDRIADYLAGLSRIHR